MTTTFTASNGIEIEISQDRYLLGKGDYGSGPTYATAGPEGIDALREYFQAERDTELGRWRDPEAPDMVVYRVPENDDEDGRAVRVMDESTGAYASLWERDVKRFERGSMHATAARHFAAHPARQPWHSATDGELWKVETTTSATPIICSTDADGDFTPVFGHPHISKLANGSHRIIEATRLWPEQETDR